MDHGLKISVWNVRGLNNPARCNVISQVVEAASPAIVCIQETKLEVVTPEVVRHCLGNKFEDFYFLPARGTRGGIILAWDRLVVALSNPHYTDCTVTSLARPVEEPEAL